jgi:hypothetical protein
VPASDKPSVLQGEIGFNAKYLADILKAAKAGFSHAKAPSCKASFYGPNNAAKFEMNKHDHSDRHGRTFHGRRHNIPQNEVSTTTALAAAGSRGVNRGTRVLSQLYIVFQHL